MCLLQRFNPLMFFVLLLVFLIFHSDSNARSSKRYYIDNIQINAEILPDGSLKIEESRSYRFKGRFSWADYSIPLQQLGSVTDFSLSEGDIT